MYLIVREDCLVLATLVFFVGGRTWTRAVAALSCGLRTHGRLEFSVNRKKVCEIATEMTELIS